jgi:hypothetical protein
MTPGNISSYNMVGTSNGASFFLIRTKLGRSADENDEIVETKEITKIWTKEIFISMIDAPEKRLAQLDGLWKHGEDVVVFPVSVMPIRPKSFFQNEAGVDSWPLYNGRMVRLSGLPAA